MRYDEVGGCQKEDGASDVSHGLDDNWGEHHINRYPSTLLGFFFSWETISYDDSEISVHEDP